jgi:hypothetical protein
MDNRIKELLRMVWTDPQRNEDAEVKVFIDTFFKILTVRLTAATMPHYVPTYIVIEVLRKIAEFVTDGASDNVVTFNLDIKNSELLSKDDLYAYAKGERETGC